MTSRVAKAELESALGRRFSLLARAPAEALSTGIPEVDAAIGGLPRGALTEICGPASSGRSSLLVAVLAAATARGEVCALVDASDALDPASAAGSGVDLDRLLWIRCGGSVEKALQATDWLVTGGGFGAVAFDLGDIPPRTARRISLTSWFRLRRAVENTPTMLVVVSQEPQAKSCASLVMETHQESFVWSGLFLRGAVHRVAVRKPARSVSARFEVRAVA